MVDKIDLETMRRVTDAALRIVQSEMSQDGLLELKQNFYWEISSPERYDTKQKPQLESIGSLHDDWEFISDLKESFSDANPLLLVHISALLLYVAEQWAERP